MYEFLSCSFLLAGMLLIDWSSSSSRRNVPEGVLGICWYVNLVSAGGCTGEIKPLESADMIGGGGGGGGGAVGFFGVLV